MATAGADSSPQTTRPRTGHHRVIVVGGGNGGISVAARLRRRGVDDIALIDPSDVHEYKPLFSHVAGGTARISETTRPQRTVIPDGVSWIRDAVSAIDPARSSLSLTGGGTLTYDHVILSPGIQYDWASVPGLAEAIGTGDVTTHYTGDLAARTSLRLRDMRAGTVVFTQPAGPASCAGAAQKPMYQACDYWQRTGVLGDIRVVMVVPDDTVFGIPAFDREIGRAIDRYGIELRTSSALIEVDADAGDAVIGSASGIERIHFDLLNVVPPQSAPEWIAAGGLAAPDDADGFVEVDPDTLRHRRYGNVWALGDAAATTNSKSGGALRKQTMVLAKNLVSALEGRRPRARYDGYGVCPMTVSRSSVVWAEFGPSSELMPTIPFFRRMYRESGLSWFFDRRILPWVYWNLILTGRV
ncbi:NAD(P)/FAD-dependent oxidoreductase [Microbacterium radiodurans]|uniref:NAD(P)/FAD-dependent oxidoreductase n=1 Tax=Microbacterium radiodurans TaxID=661398 RepID=A0A5J5INJ9_9MICO|nr:FAD/NAD(P)-binding oxidoreductase [Microbacterium radiodurans]KAA9085213.1 NAD(P)/FAD-dependent oxidoreductase [Microbacterium radiodurans]